MADLGTIGGHTLIPLQGFGTTAPPPSGLFASVQFGTNLAVTDLGSNVIRVDASSAGNLDGGSPSSVYGGTTPIDGGPV